MKNNILTLIFVLGSLLAYSQEMRYNIFSTYGQPIQKAQLAEAKSMSDINIDYPSSWIKKSDYISSQIKARISGNSMIATGENDVFNSEQLMILQKADVGSNIDIEVKYKKINSITQNADLKTMKFSVSLVPEKEAKFPGGEEAILAYLKLQAADKIMKTEESKLESATVIFVVNEEGKAIKPVITTTSKNEKIDQLLLNTIINMPNWTPALSASGKRIEQEFEFVIGTMIGC